MAMSKSAFTISPMTPEAFMVATVETWMDTAKVGSAKMTAAEMTAVTMVLGESRGCEEDSRRGESCK